ncbi:MAG: ABC transporter ATP-binding protein [Pirellulaceae bacterium]
MNRESAIATTNLSKGFGDFYALADCNLTIEPATVMGLLGPNGAGKSTLIRLLMGFLTPTRGTASVHGNDVIRDRLAVHQDVSYLPSSPRLFRTMNGRGVLKFFAQLRGDGDLQLAMKIARRLDLDLSRWVAFMSTGMRQKLAIAVAFANRARVLILDEPTENLDPNIRSIVVELVAEAKTAGRTVLFSSHVLSEVEEVADRVAILRAGRLVHEQPMSDLKFYHRIVARTSQGIAPPESLREMIAIRQLEENRVEIDVEGDLSRVLSWLSSIELQDMYIEATGLKAVYDRFHSETAEVRS